MVDKWPPHTRLPLIYLNHLLPTFLQISYIRYFYQSHAQVVIWALSDNQEVRQNDRHLLVCTCGHSDLAVILFNCVPIQNGDFPKGNNLSQFMRFPLTMWYVRPAKPKISMRMLQKLVPVYTCQNATLLEISCHGSFKSSSLWSLLPH